MCLGSWVIFLQIERKLYPSKRGSSRTVRSAGNLLWDWWRLTLWERKWYMVRNKKEKYQAHNFVTMKIGKPQVSNTLWVNCFLIYPKSNWSLSTDTSIATHWHTFLTEPSRTLAQVFQNCKKPFKFIFRFCGKSLILQSIVT